MAVRESMRRSSRGWRALAVVLIAAVVASGCAARLAYQKGREEARRGNWDAAVGQLTRALLSDPENIDYKLALENARVQASRQHYEKARRHLAAGEVANAVDELEIAVKYDSSNKMASDELAAARSRSRAEQDEKERLASFEELQRRARAQVAPVPVLSPRSPVPIFLNFPDQSLQKVFETMGKLTGVNVLFDESFRDRKVSVNLSGVSFQEALDQLTFSNRFFYRVLDQNTLIIVPDTPAKRRQYEEQLLQTFYVSNAEIKELTQILKTQLGTGPRYAENATLGAITITGNPDELAIAQRIIQLNDKARGEVIVEVQILDVNRTKAREWGLRLANNQSGEVFGLEFRPHTDTKDALTNLRAHLLSSINLADFVVSVPSSIFTRWLQSDTTSRILASPRLRAADGKKSTLKIGREVPVPVTTIQTVNSGGSTYAPATSFQYRNVGITMDITPRVTASGEITLEMAAEFSLLGPQESVAGELLPTFLTRSVNGLLRVRDGETSLVGGLLQDTETELIRGHLGLSQIPILGRLLSENTRGRNQNEILISITPHLVRAPRVDAEDMGPLLVGTRESLRVAGARPPLFGLDPGETAAPPLPPSTGGSTVTTPSSPAPIASPRVPRPQATPPLPGTAIPQPIASPAVVPEAMRPPGEPGNRSSDTPMPGVEPPIEDEVLDDQGEFAAADPAPAASAPTSGTGTFSPAAVTVSTGGRASVGIVAMDVTLTQVVVTLAYDPALVEVDDILPGPLLTLDGATLGTDKELSPGRARAVFSRPTPVSGSGVLATVVVRGVRGGTTFITPSEVTLTTPAGDQGLRLRPVSVTVTP